MIIGICKTALVLALIFNFILTLACTKKATQTSQNVMLTIKGTLEIMGFAYLFLI